jgi:hypothetical protein
MQLWSDKLWQIGENANGDAVQFKEALGPLVECCERNEQFFLANFVKKN